MNDQWIDWLQVSRRHFFYGILFVVAAFFVAFQVYEKFTTPQTNYFLTANQAYDKWVHQGEAFENLEELIQAQPELETKFGALIANRFIVQNQVERAEPFADAVLARVASQTPDHTAYAESTLLISKGQFREALARSVALKARSQDTSLLYGFNLIRIASLFCALDARDEEVAALEELENYLNTHEEESRVLTECFREGNVTLKDYISHRKKIIL